MRLLSDSHFGMCSAVPSGVSCVAFRPSTSITHTFAGSPRLADEYASLEPSGATAGKEFLRLVSRVRGIDRPAGEPLAWIGCAHIWLSSVRPAKPRRFPSAEIVKPRTAGTPGTGI